MCIIVIVLSCWLGRCSAPPTCSHALTCVSFFSAKYPGPSSTPKTYHPKTYPLSSILFIDRR